MTVNIPGSSVVEIKLDRLIDEMRFLKSHTIAFDTRMRSIEAYLIASEPSEEQPESKSTPRFAPAAARRQRQLCLESGQRSERP